MDVRRVVNSVPLLQGLPELARTRIAAAGSVANLRAGAEIWARGEAASAFVFLVEGRVRLVVIQDKQREFLIDMIDEPGGLLCAPAVCAAATHCCGAICSLKSKLLFVPRELLLPHHEPADARTLLLREASSRALGLCRRLREVGGAKVQHRVAAVLLRLADERGCPHRGQVRLPSSISRRELAGLSGCATETLIRVLAQLEQQGAISRAEHALVVDVELLWKHAQLH